MVACLTISGKDVSCSTGVTSYPACCNIDAVPPVEMSLNLGRSARAFSIKFKSKKFHLKL
jgi:hypothetical protein